MVRRVVDTAFWTDMDVIDNYSVEDKYFYLYLMTNAKTTQVGIYALPIKVMSFETGYTVDVIRVLLERFNSKYKKIIYSNSTQEVTLLHSLQTTILKGGKPVSDLLEKELTRIKDGNLILDTYYAMKEFWELSKRKFDKNIKELFEIELLNRKLLNDNDIKKKNDIHIENEIDNDNKNQNYNDNEESSITNRGTNREIHIEDADERKMLERYANYLKKLKPNIIDVITPNNIVEIFYKELIGEVSPHIETEFDKWKKIIPKSLILEALNRSRDGNTPVVYAATIISNWVKNDVKSIKDVLRLDKEYINN